MYKLYDKNCDFHPTCYWEGIKNDCWEQTYKNLLVCNMLKFTKNAC